MTLTIHDVEQSEEEWREIPGYPLYEVSNLGRVRSYRTKAKTPGWRRAVPVMKATHVKKSGYLGVSLQKERGKCSGFAVHRHVALAFLGPCPEGMQVAHNDGNRLNPRADNLRYATPLENTRDKYIHGTMHIGEASSVAKLTEAQIQEIRECYRPGVRQVDLAIAFGVCQSTISNVVRRAVWTHVPEVAS